MATRQSAVQAELDEALQDIGTVQEILQEAYTPEATREELAGAIGRALEALEDYESDDDDDSDEEGVDE